MKECEWREDSDGIWQTGCGMEFVFIDSGPKENRLLFCCYCGKSLRSKSASDVTDDSGRIVAPPQPALPTRPPGPWTGNTDARGGGNDTGE